MFHKLTLLSVLLSGYASLNWSLLTRKNGCFIIDFSKFLSSLGTVVE